MRIVPPDYPLALYGTALRSECSSRMLAAVAEEKSVIR